MTSDRQTVSSIKDSSPLSEPETKDSRTFDLAWNNYCELRKEIINLLEIRSKLVTGKITLVSAAITIIIGTIDKPYPKWIILLPTVVAVFFDFVIHSLIITSKKIDKYFRDQLEPLLRKEAGSEFSILLWSEYSHSNRVAPLYFPIGNFGITLCFASISLGVIFYYQSFLSSFLSTILIALVVTVDVMSFYIPAKMLGYSTRNHISLITGDIPYDFYKLLTSKVRLLKSRLPFARTP